MWLKKLIERIKNPKEKSPHDIIALEKKRLRSESEHHNESNINDNNNSNNEAIPTTSTNQDSITIEPNREKSTKSTKSNRNRLNSSVDPLSNTDSELNRISSNRSRQQRAKRSSSIISRSRSRSRSPVFRNSFGDNDDEELDLDEELALDNEYLRRTISSRSGRSQGRPSMNRRRSSVEMMRDLANDERDLESLNLSQSLPEGFNTDNRNW